MTISKNQIYKTGNIRFRVHEIEHVCGLSERCDHVEVEILDAGAFSDGTFQFARGEIEAAIEIGTIKLERGPSE